MATGLMTKVFQASGLRSAQQPARATTHRSQPRTITALLTTRSGKPLPDGLKRALHTLPREIWHNGITSLLNPIRCVQGTIALDPFASAPIACATNFLKSASAKRLLIRAYQRSHQSHDDIALCDGGAARKLFAALQDAWHQLVNDLTSLRLVPTPTLLCLFASLGFFARVLDASPPASLRSHLAD